VTKEQHTIRGTAQKCLEISRKLQENLNFSEAGRYKGLRKALIPVKALHRKNEINKGKKEMVEIQRIMQTQLAEGSWYVRSLL
jgi:hypothetical protein